MNVETWTEAALFLKKEYINGIFVTVHNPTKEIARSRINVVIICVSKNQLWGKNSVVIRGERCRVAYLAPHYFGSLDQDPDLNKNEKLDPYPRQSQIVRLWRGLTWSHGGQ